MDLVTADTKELTTKGMDLAAAETTTGMLSIADIRGVGGTLINSLSCHWLRL